jgi:formamidopyrimidine-DNA glycosylase
MPELPDIAAYLTALEKRILNEPLAKIRINSPFLLRTVTPPTTAFENQTVRTLRRVGKRIAIGFDHDLWLVLHLMIAGRLHWKPAATRLAGKNQLAAFDFPNGSLLLTEAGSSRRASLHLFSSTEEMLGTDPGGIDVFAITAEQFQSAMTKENHTLKRALTDPRILSGIGNAYSDEILHAAKLSPIRQTNKLNADEWQRLFHETRAILRQWIDRLQTEAQSDFPEKVTAFRPDMTVHGRFGLPCPVCSQPIQRIRYAGNETNYCPICQTDGRLLADRGLSRLLGKDWPKTLEELELLRRH